MASHGELNVQEFELTLQTSGREAEIKLHLHSSSGRTKGYPISGFPRDFFKEIDRVEVDSEEIEEMPKERMTRSMNPSGIPAIKLLSGKGVALLRPGAPGTVSEQNLSTQPYGPNEDDRSKSDDDMTRAESGKTSRSVSLKAKFSKLTLRDHGKQPQETERRSRSMDIPRGIQHDGFLATDEHDGQESCKLSRHRTSFSTDSPPEQAQREREMASLTTKTYENTQNEGAHDNPCVPPETNPRYLPPNSTPRMSMPQPTLTPMSTSNPQWQTMYPPCTFQQPPGPATISTSSGSTAVPSSTYEHHRPDNTCSSPNTAAAQSRTTSTFDYTPRAPAQPGHVAPQRPPSNNPYHQPRPHEANANMKADLELEFALQISLADHGEEQQEEQRRLVTALEESRRDAHLY